MVGSCLPLSIFAFRLFMLCVCGAVTLAGTMIWLLQLHDQFHKKEPQGAPVLLLHMGLSLLVGLRGLHRLGITLNRMLEHGRGKFLKKLKGTS